MTVPAKHMMLIFSQARHLYRVERNKKQNSALTNWFMELIEPLSLMWVFYILKGKGAINLDNLQMPYFAYIAFGLIGYLIFANTLLQSMNTLQKQAAFAKNFELKIDALIVKEILVMIRQLAVSVILISLILVFFDHFDGLTNVIQIASILIILGIWGLAIGLLLSPFQLISTNISLFSNIAVRFGLFVSGVFFPFMVDGIAGTLLDLNPIAQLLQTLRSLIWFADANNFNLKTILICVFPLFLMVLSRHFVSSGLKFIRQGA